MLFMQPFANTDCKAVVGVRGDSREKGGSSHPENIKKGVCEVSVLRREVAF